MTATLAQQLEALWESSDSPPDVFEFLQQHNGAAGDDVLGVLLTDQNHRWKTEAPHKVEDYLKRLPDLASDPDVKLQLAVGEYQARQAADTDPNIDEYTSRFSDISDQLRSKLSELASGAGEPQVQSSVTATFLSEQTVGDGQFGRYRLERVLGEGAFGRVYLAYDEELQRQVAIKVPTAERFQQPEDAEQYLAEARTVASLNHPNIVPVHDVGRTDDGSIYVVSKFIEGCTLDDRIKQDRPSHNESAKLIATVAQALHHAHDRRLIHRDVKSSNILLEGADATPYVADFGLAIREEDYLKDRKLAGTPAYMSPEQARGEGHRLDGRSDIFSLGVVLYELLTGKKPFRGSTPNELLHQVVSVDPRHPRELDESIPPELERICLKALSKRASDRYATAVELADDLLNWNQSPQQEQQEHQIVPKGLRSFDEGDADFFLDLLPGPRNRSGLPESIQFWKSRIEEADSDKTFSVGLIYGPSGCGKSSLVKAGLLPRLSKDVTAIYVEATPDETEARILRGLRKSLPELPQDLGLVETFSLLRRAEGTKVVVVLDQFEQWLHAHRAEQETELVAALRQCDGGSLQAVVMVRDDFWMAASRFMSDVEVEIVQGANVAVADLFSVKHARKVLRAFGRAYGDLDAAPNQDNHAFLEQTVSGLAQDGKVVSVRLALFAEMVKGKPWVPATLDEVGGTEGIGVNFLEETFSSRTANPKHRLHQQAAREVLKALLPEVGSDIKGHMRSHSELLEASGYQNRHDDFNDLLRILDGELRLITPTDPEGFQTKSGSDPGSKFYQLTHDFLVPSLQDWLTRKQKETRRGRAELALADRASVWNATPENRQLPSLAQWCQIRLLTDKTKWTQPQRKMMARARRVRGLQWGSALAFVLAVTVAIQQYVAAVRRYNLEKTVRTAVSNLMGVRGELVPFTLDNFEEDFPRSMVIDELVRQYELAEEEEKLSLAYGFARYGKIKDELVELLASSILTVPATELNNITTALAKDPEVATRYLLKQKDQANSAQDWKWKSRLAVVGLHLEDPTIAVDIHRDRLDPTQQTVFIYDVFPTWHGDLKQMPAVIDDADNVSLRAGMCLAMGNLPSEELGDARSRWQDLLIKWYTRSSDSATHGAAVWALRQWGVTELPNIPVDTTDPKDRDWKLTPMGREHGFTMVRIPAGKFQRTDGNTEQTVTLTRDLWLSDVEVTVRLFQQFMDDEMYHDKNPNSKPEDWKGVDARISPTGRHPAQNVSWFDAVLFCNWLTWREGRTPCYKVEVSSVTLLPDGTGYRLPTEAEWEYACRGGTTTDFGFGRDAERLKHYAVFNLIQAEMVGGKMCNRWGLFDIHGNVYEWCHDWYGDYSGAKVENPTGVGSGSLRVHRGGSWRHNARICQAEYRYRHPPSYRNYSSGFRVAQVPLPAKLPASGAESESR